MTILSDSLKKYLEYGDEISLEELPDIIEQVEYLEEKINDLEDALDAVNDNYYDCLGMLNDE